MGLKSEEIKNLIKTAIPDAEISIQDLAGDENHYSATIKSKVFTGKSKIEQHKIVYKALGGKMGNELHALALNTKINTKRIWKRSNARRASKKIKNATR